MANTDAGISLEVKRMKLEKRNADGELFEVIEFEGEKASRVTFRKAGLAPLSSYAIGLLLDEEN